MRFGGWLPLRRGIFEHTLSGKLTNHEMLVLLCLITLADHRTGSGTTNAVVIRTFLPGLKYDAAKRALCSLEEKSYIFRKVIYKSRMPYRYWVGKYEVTEGPNKLLLTNITKALVSGDEKDITYIKAARQTALETSLETSSDTSLETALLNNTNTNTDTYNEKTTLLLTGECAPSCADGGLLVGGAACGVKHTSGQGSAPLVRPWVADGSAMGPLRLPEGSAEAPLRLPKGSAEAPPRTAGLLWSGADGAFLDKATGDVVTQLHQQKRLSLVGLEMREMQFYELTTGEMVARGDALRRAA